MPAMKPETIARRSKARADAQTERRLSAMVRLQANAMRDEALGIADSIFVELVREAEQRFDAEVRANMGRTTPLTDEVLK